MSEGADVVAAGIAEGGDEQVDLDGLVTDGDLTAAEIDLQLLTGWRLESHRGLGGQCLAEGSAGALHRMQADRVAMFELPVLQDHSGVAGVLQETSLQPILQTIE